MLNPVSMFGLAGTITASILFYPQVWVAYRTKRTRDLAWLTIVIGVVNASIWITYGAFKADPFILITNAFVLVATIALGLLKARYDKPLPESLNGLAGELSES